jgi:vacuolar protein sorting-associated protein 18
LDFALRLFKRKNIIKAQISIIGLMGYYEEAVDLAIEHEILNIAKIYANKPEEE